MLIDERWLAVVDVFSNAAIDNTGWDRALMHFAELTNASVGQIVGVSPTGDLAINANSDFDPEAPKVLAEMDTYRPDFNPRVRAGLSAPEMAVQADHQFASEEERKHSPYYADYCRRFDIAYGCQSCLIRQPDLMIGVATFRGERIGAFQPGEMRLFESIIPHIRNAIRTNMMLRDAGLHMLSGTLEAMNLAAYVCDARGNLKATTESAESLLSAGHLLRRRHGRLHGAARSNANVLDDSITRMSLPSIAERGGNLSTIVLRDIHDQPAVLDVIALPTRDYALDFSPRVMVIVRQNHPEAHRIAPVLRIAYRLTDAEIDVALRIVAGESVETIAVRRDVSVGTVRAQLRAIYPKMGVHRQAELIACINSLN